MRARELRAMERIGGIPVTRVPNTGPSSIPNTPNAPKAGANPWGAATLDWTTSTPPDPHNFTHTPTVHRGPYDFHLIAEMKRKAESSGDGADGTPSDVKVTTTEDS